jgi:hypothetical protein|nr:MAG TPA: hypothetical protein [Caudoviricetes sp.]
MDSLHLGYEEVVYRIPYRNLVIMQMDKLHMVYGERVKKTSGKDMVKRKG